MQIIITPDRSKEQYKYDNVRNITAVTDGNGNCLEYMYNWRNQTEIVTAGLGACDSHMMKKEIFIDS